MKTNFNNKRFLSKIIKSYEPSRETNKLLENVYELLLPFHLQIKHLSVNEYQKQLKQIKCGV